MRYKEIEMTVADQIFFSPTYGTLSFSQVISRVGEIVRFSPGQPFRISVGTDSEELSGLIKFVSVIHVWHVGHGAKAFRTQESISPKTNGRGAKKGFRQRIYEEVIRTAMLAQEVRSALREVLGEQTFGEHLEVHADVGENGGTSVMLKEVIGMLKGYGFAEEYIKLKPESYAASAVADYYI